MDNISIFQDKAIEPTDKDLAEKLDSSYAWWQKVCKLVFSKYPAGLAEWNYPGKKYGWSFRIKDKKRAIIYLLPRDKYFKVAMIFGQKAFDQIMDSPVAEEIKNELRSATKYPEGRGIRIDVTDNTLIPDIERLIEIKLMN